VIINDTAAIVIFIVLGSLLTICWIAWGVLSLMTKQRTAKMHYELYKLRRDRHHD